MVIIKGYEAKYREHVQQVCITTGPDEAATDPKVREYILNTFCNYYIEQESENAFVLVDETDTAQGYVLGALSFRKFFKNMKPYLKSVKKTGNKNYFSAVTEILAHSVFSFKYPSHLHIDINKDFRGNGNGSKLIATLTENLRKQGSKGVMLIVGSHNTKAIKFYKKNGFRTLLSLKNSGTVMAKEL